MGASRLATVGWAFTMQQQELYLFTTSTQLTFIKKPPIHSIGGFSTLLKIEKLFKTY